jgi:hypothetical protein
MLWMHLAIGRMERRNVPELRGLPQLPEMEGLGETSPGRARARARRSTRAGRGLVPAE